jgi:pilus assembly protein Flp/PilA
MSIRKLLTRLMRDERATSAVEYGLILGLVVLTMLAALSGMAGVVQSTWNNVANQTTSASSQAAAS